MEPGIIKDKITKNLYRYIRTKKVLIDLTPDHNYLYINDRGNGERFDQKIKTIYSL